MLSLILLVGPVLIALYCIFHRSRLTEAQRKGPAMLAGAVCVILGVVVSQALEGIWAGVWIYAGMINEGSGRKQ